MTDDSRVRWFGKSWNAPVNRDCDPCPTPIGLKCIGCGVEIKDGDYGTMMGYCPADSNEPEYLKAVQFAVENDFAMVRVPMHHLCMIRSILPPEQAKVHEIAERLARRAEDKTP